MRTRPVFYVFAGCTLAVLAAAVAYMLAMPGVSYRGPLPKLTAAERDTASRLRADVTALATERRVGLGDTLAAAANVLFTRLNEARGSSKRGEPPRREQLDAAAGFAQNLVWDLPGRKGSEWIVVGAHYDSAHGTPGANDNGSGVAVLLELARRFAADPPQSSLRFVLFANEEPPFFGDSRMGSAAHAAAAHARGEAIRLMFSLETMGYFSDRPGTQRYPWPLSLAYPNTGNFIGFVANLGSAASLREVVRRFREHVQFPSEAAALPEDMPGVGWSDHASFWRYGYSAIMVTDTALFRYPHYHRASDLPEQLDYERLARVTSGLERVLRDLTTRSTN